MYGPRFAAAMERHGCHPGVQQHITAPLSPERSAEGNMPTHCAPLCPDQGAVEQMLAALWRSASWQVARLRYFIQWYTGGRIGEDPLGIPNNPFPFITQVAAGRRALRIFGNDYPRPMEPASVITARNGSG